MACGIMQVYNSRIYSILPTIVEAPPHGKRLRMRIRIAKINSLRGAHAQFYVRRSTPRGSGWVRRKNGVYRDP